MGFKPPVEDRPELRRPAGHGELRPSIELIRALWSEWTRGDGTADGLNTWTLRTFKVSSLRFLTKGQGQRAITALKEVKSRAA